jgi:hypothetical protein
LRQPGIRAGHQVLAEATFLASSVVGRTQFAGGRLVPKPVLLFTPASGASEGVALGRQGKFNVVK